MTIHSLSVASLLALTSAAQAVTAWLPEAGTGSLDASFVGSSYDTFILTGPTLDSPLGGSVDQYSIRVGATFGLTSRLALDVNTGFAWVQDDGFTGLKDEALDDSRIGLTYALTQEDGMIPALAVRAGGIIAGTYDVGQPYSIGDGANGGEVSLLWGKSLGDSGFSILGDVGYRWRGDDVPEDFFFSAGVAKNIFLSGGDSINLYAGYRSIAGQSGGNIGGPGFGTLFGFPQVREEVQGIDFALGYTDKGGRSYTLSYSQVIEGRNTAETKALALSVNIPF
jgi:hypothetical protein